MAQSMVRYASELFKDPLGHAYNGIIVDDRDFALINDLPVYKQYSADNYKSCNSSLVTRRQYVFCPTTIQGEVCFELAVPNEQKKVARTYRCDLYDQYILGIQPNSKESPTLEPGVLSINDLYGDNHGIAAPVLDETNLVKNSTTSSIGPHVSTSLTHESSVHGTDCKPSTRLLIEFNEINHTTRGQNVTVFDRESVGTLPLSYNPEDSSNLTIGENGIIRFANQMTVAPTLAVFEHDIKPGIDHNAEPSSSEDNQDQGLREVAPTRVDSQDTDCRSNICSSSQISSLREDITGYATVEQSKKNEVLEGSKTVYEPNVITVVDHGTFPGFNFGYYLSNRTSKIDNAFTTAVSTAVHGLSSSHKITGSQLSFQNIERNNLYIRMIVTAKSPGVLHGFQVTDSACTQPGSQPFAPWTHEHNRSFGQIPTNKDIRKPSIALRLSYADISKLIKVQSFHRRCSKLLVSARKQLEQGVGTLVDPELHGVSGLGLAGLQNHVVNHVGGVTDSGLEVIAITWVSRNGDNKGVDFHAEIAIDYGLNVSLTTFRLPVPSSLQTSRQSKAVTKNVAENDQPIRMYSSTSLAIVASTVPQGTVSKLLPLARSAHIVEPTQSYNYGASSSVFDDLVMPCVYSGPNKMLLSLDDIEKKPRTDRIDQIGSSGMDERLDMIMTSLDGAVEHEDKVSHAFESYRFSENPRLENKVSMVCRRRSLAKTESTCDFGTPQGKNSEPRSIIATCTISNCSVETVLRYQTGNTPSVSPTIKQTTAGVCFQNSDPKQSSNTVKAKIAVLERNCVGAPATSSRTDIELLVSRFRIWKQVRDIERRSLRLKPLDETIIIPAPIFVFVNKFVLLKRRSQDVDCFHQD